MYKNDKLAIVLDYMKYQLAFEMLANDYAQKFIEKEDLCIEIGTRQSYQTKEVMETFLSKATDKMAEIVNSVYKGENK